MKIILVGGGGHCGDVLSIMKQPKLDVEGIIDEGVPRNYFQIPVIGTDEDIIRYDKTHMFLITIGQTGWKARIRIFDRLRVLKAKFTTQIADTVKRLSFSEIGEGTVIMHNVFLGPGSSVGDNCIINTGSIISHDVRIGNHCHICPGAIVLGGALIEDQCTIGPGVVVGPGQTVKKRTSL